MQLKNCSSYYSHCLHTYTPRVNNDFGGSLECNAPEAFNKNNETKRVKIRVLRKYKVNVEFSKMFDFWSFFVQVKSNRVYWSDQPFLQKKQLFVFKL